MAQQEFSESRLYLTHVVMGAAAGAGAFLESSGLDESATAANVIALTAGILGLKETRRAYQLAPQLVGWKRFFPWRRLGPQLIGDVVGVGILADTGIELAIHHNVDLPTRIIGAAACIGLPALFTACKEEGYRQLIDYQYIKGVKS